jgi:DNA-directed RNA polymerase subunit beta'
VVSALRSDGPLRLDPLRDAREFTSVQIQIASPKVIRDWSYGEVTKPETINYRTLKPEREGLFDEKIFGPEKDWECACGKYRGQRFAAKVCERCGVEVTKATVRRYRMGHIELATPCAHIWYVKDVPSKVGALLNLSASDLEQVLYFGKYIVTEAGDAKHPSSGRPLRRADLLSDDEYRQTRYGFQETYSVAMGEQALVKDGEMVEAGQPLAKGVRSKLAGIAQYRFPRKLTIDYRELRDARLILPKVAWIEGDRYAAGEPIAELDAELEIRAEDDGVIDLLPIGAGGVAVLRDAEDDSDVRYTYLLPVGVEPVVGTGEFVEKGTVIARASAGSLRLPQGATASLRASRVKDKQVTMTLEIRWARTETIELNPTMHVLVGDGANVKGGEKVVGAIDPAAEIIAAADGTVTLAEPASIIVSRARVYPYQDEPTVVNGDRVQPGDVLADDGAVRSQIPGRIEIDLVRRSVRVIECYDFEARMGADAVRELLESIDLEKLEAELVEEMQSPSRHRRAKARKRLEVTRSFLKSGSDPAWMILEVVPIMPPNLRPMVQVEGGRFATSDLNDLYRRLINRNNRLKKLIHQGAPEMIVRNEKRMLQEAVDALIDNGRRGSAVVHPGSERPLRSLTDLLGGKQGRFRQNLLGKRVDYSGRSVIVVGPQLKLHQCGVPKRMALELFKPFLFKKLEERGIVSNIKSARKLLDRYRDTREEIWDALEEVIADRVVLLNRAPTLHRLGIQAFEPVLVEGQAIQLHPLVCEAFNADFDGDQMAIHVPLSVYAQAEARLQMLSSHNLLSPAHGNPNVQAARDIILGLFVLTAVHVGKRGAGRTFDDPAAALSAYARGEIDRNAEIVVAGRTTSAGRIKYRFADADEALLAAERGDVDMQDVVTVMIEGRLIETSPGRVFFARLVRETLAEDGGSVPASMIRYDVAYEKGALRDLVIESFKLLGIERTAKLLDGLKQAGFELSTTSGITIGIDDVAIPPAKKELLAQAQAKLERIQEYAEMGFVTDTERYQQVVRLWNDTTEQVKQAVFENFERNMPFNPLYVMAQSGARGNPQQIRQLAGMRGLMAKPSGDTIELPIRSNFREGLDVLEYFISTHGARKGGADTALRTADSGYLTRKLVDVAHELVVREDDCGTAEGIPIELYTPEGRPRPRSQLDMSLYGRTLAEDVIFGDVAFAAGATLMREDVEVIVGRFASYPDVRQLAVRSPIACQTRAGVCRTCYGLDLSTMRPVSLGEAVGVIAAESIGEPGTQLTMRTFHTGGVATGGDITQGLPRVIELVEARKPKVKAFVAEIEGRVSIQEDDDRNRITVTSDDQAFVRMYKIDKTTRILVRDGDQVTPGQPLTRGAINPHDLLESGGPAAVQAYLIEEIQRVYRGQGVSVHDKHIETIVRQMLKYVEVQDPGDSLFLEGQTVERFDVQEENERLMAEEKRPIVWKQTLLGITKASLTTKSWLSAASFQHTTHVLTEAAVAGKSDDLVGLKENVILGRLIPAGTGLAAIRSVRVADERTLAKQRATGAAAAAAPRPLTSPSARVRDLG